MRVPFSPSKETLCVPDKNRRRSLDRQIRFRCQWPEGRGNSLHDRRDGPESQQSGPFHRHSVSAVQVS
jgi:hypothetical protein